jgi:hypothetical protein
VTGPATLALTQEVRLSLQAHLFPGDGLEAAAILLCARIPEPRLKFLVRDVLLVPHEDCLTRAPNSIIWPGEWLETALDQGEAEQLSLILIHSHPGGLFAFSGVDDRSDLAVMPSLIQGYDTWHGSAIMVPDGRVRARVYAADMTCIDIDLVTTVGDDLDFCWRDTPDGHPRPVAFTSAMTAELNRLSVTVIGVSGTGSIVAEQAARLGFGKVVLIDFDRVELKNLNRILNSTLSDVEASAHKAEMFADVIASYRGRDVPVAVVKNVMTREAVLASSQTDLVFSCVDTLEARYIADLISTWFLLPLIDVGVVIPTRLAGAGRAIGDVIGRIDYVRPGGPSLCDRQVYTAASLREEYMRQNATDAYAAEVRAGYLQGMVEEAPAVITLNMRAAAAAMNEFIARGYPYRLDNNAKYARTVFSLAAGEEDYFDSASFANSPSPNLGRGVTEPLLGLPILSL